MVAELVLVRRMSAHLDAIFHQWGSSWVGRSRWLSHETGPPFAALYIYRDELVLRTPFGRRSFPRKHIQQIHRYWRGPTAGLQIDHDVTDQPAFVVFWPSDIDELEKVLDANAFPVTTLSV